MQVSRSYTRLFSVLLLSSTLSACAYIIPPNPNQPRNNTVQGGMRKPINNPVTGGGHSSINTPQAPATQPAAGR
jgi:hypothetical protein